jgi:hypothetical protein
MYGLLLLSALRYTFSTSSVLLAMQSRSRRLIQIQLTLLSSNSIFFSSAFAGIGVAYAC